MRECELERARVLATAPRVRPPRARIRRLLRRGGRRAIRRVALVVAVVAARVVVVADIVAHGVPEPARERRVWDVAPKDRGHRARPHHDLAARRRVEDERA